MSNPTTPFSWQMPTNTDLVTDLPADFEVFGQAVATSMADLLGGTSGQVLAKNSNTDMDFVWVAQDDSNAIQNAIVDAKGDLIGATAADTPARLAVGTNGQILTADSTAVTGLKWETPSAGGGGLVFINKTDFTASSAVNVNSVFSTTYDNYRVMVVGASTTASALTASFKMRVGGADTSSNYNSQRAYFIGTTVGAALDPAGTDELYIGDFGTTSNKNSVANLDISSPYTSTPTTFTGVCFSVVNSLILTGGTQKDNTSFTGLSLLFDQTCTGSVYIYGYAKA
jgi:hypothetical protein